MVHSPSRGDNGFLDGREMWILIPLSQEPVSCDYLEPAESSLRHLILYLWDSSEIFPPIQAKSIQEAPFLITSATKSCTYFYTFPWQTHASPILYSLTWLPKDYLEESMKRWTDNHAVFPVSCYYQRAKIMEILLVYSLARNINKVRTFLLLFSDVSFLFKNMKNKRLY